MTKEKETDDYVWYKIEVRAKTDKFEIDKRGRKIAICKNLYGTFRFKKESYNYTNQNDFKIENHIVFIDQETDSVLLTQKNDILIRCLVVMGKHLKEGSFPEKTMLATG